jgi:NADH-quinone oxidoreductase subunit J
MLYAFIAIAFICILSALGMILSRNPIHSIILLIICFFSISGLYVLMNAQFLAVVNVIVYAGAIMVLFLFVVMMMNLNEDSEPKQKAISYLLPAIASGLLGLVLIASVKKATLIPLGNVNDQAGMIENLGKVLLHEYLLPFEMTSVLFLSAMVGVVLLAKKEKSVGDKL